MTQRDHGATPSAPAPPSTGMADRILEIVRALLPERGPDEPVAEGAGDDIIRVAERSIERWVQRRRRSRPWHERELDALAVVDQPVELLARFDGVVARDLEVVFLVDGEVVGVGATTDLGLALCSYVPRAIGLHQVTTELRDEAGALVPELRRAARLQVVRDAAVVIADARLFDVYAPEALWPLRELVRRGVDLCWADRGAAERTLPTEALIAAAGLPPTAVLAIDDRELDFDTLGVDFGPVNERLVVRRLRAAGVPLVAAIAMAPIAGGVEAADLSVWTLPELATRLARPEGLEELTRAAGAFVDARDRSVGAAALTRRLDLMTGTRAVTGNRVTVELDNRAARAVLLDDIDQAERSVHLQFYQLEPGRFAASLSERLRARARAGVAVRLVVDALYARHGLLGRTNRVLADLEGEPGIEIVSSDPITLGGLDALALKQRDHRKLAIIDDRVAYVTGRNGADTYYLGFDEVAIDDATLHEVIPWLDAHARLTGPLVAELQRIFLANWRRNGGAAVGLDAAAPTSAEGGDVAARVILHDGGGDAFAMSTYDALFAGARERLIVVNDFPIIADLALRLIGAAQRGVRVDILTGNGLARRADGSFFSGPRHRQLFEYMVKRCYEPLMRAGVRVAEYVAPELPNISASVGPIRPYVHAKLVVVDGVVASVGTANLDVTASHWEREVNLVIESPTVARSLAAELEALLARAYPLDPTSEYWRREAARRALAGQLWPDRLYS